MRTEYDLRKQAIGHRLEVNRLSPDVRWMLRTRYESDTGGDCEEKL